MNAESSFSKVRWWPAATVLALAAVYLAWAWLGEAESDQIRMIRTFPGVFFSVVLLLVWLFLFSRLPGRLRLRLFGGFAVLALAVAGLFFAGAVEIEGVSGNLAPDLKWNWGVSRDYGTRAAPGRAGVTAPGPDDYPQFNGPRRDGKVEGVRLARDWQSRPPREVWRHDVGEGWSSFAVVGEAAVTQEQRGSEETVVRYELTTGKTVWNHGYEARFESTIGGNGPRATPTVADGLVFSLGATGVLTVLDLDDGTLLWSENVAESNGGSVPPWGISSSPLVVGDYVVVQPGWTSEASLAAYRRETGELVWKAGPEHGSYSSPLLATVAGRPQIVIVNQESVSGHDPETGQMLWQSAWPGKEAKVSMPLLMGEDRLLVSAGYGIGSLLLEVSPAGGDTFSVETRWESRRLKSKFANMVLYEGTVYGLDDGILAAIDPATGERLWKRGRLGHGQLILAGDLLLIQSEKGPVVLAEPHPDEYRELGRLPALEDKTWNPPALSGRYLLVRNHREAVCYELPLDG